MSTNFYLDYPHNRYGHLGKSAAGVFTAHAPKDVDSFEDWISWISDRKIFAESGYEVDFDEFVGMVLSTGPNPWCLRHDAGEFYDRGILFVRDEFC